MLSLVSLKLEMTDNSNISYLLSVVLRQAIIKGLCGGMLFKYM